MLLVKKSELVRCFADDGGLTAPLAFMVKGDENTFTNIMQAQELTAVRTDAKHMVTLIPVN